MVRDVGEKTRKHQKQLSTTTKHASEGRMNAAWLTHNHLKKSKCSLVVVRVRRARNFAESRTTEEGGVGILRRDFI
jgi:hypothetical protein